MLSRHLGLPALVAGLVTIFVSGGSTVAGNAQPSPARNATLLLRTDREQYSMRDTIAIDVGLRNDGRQPIYVYNEMAWGPGGGLVLVLRDYEGEIVKPVVMDDTMLPPPPEDDPFLLMRLGPGMFFGTTRDLEVKELVPKAGRYTIQVEYRAALPRTFARPDQRDLPALWMESPSIWSRKVDLDVRK